MAWKSNNAHTPYGCWRLYLSAEDKPLYIIRDLGDGRQQKLDPITHAVIDTYGQIGGKAMGHHGKQKTEKVQLMIGDAHEAAVIKDIFDLHFRQGWGGKRIADYLNRKNVPSPQGKKWSQRQVEVIYYQEAYTGRSVGNRTSSGIYHQRSPSSPKQVHLDPAVLANAKTIPPRMRPKEEWFVIEQPLLKDFLADEQLRQLAIAGQDQHWNHLADADRPKRSKSKHKTSDYLLSGLLVAKQDGAPLVGVLCGRVGKKVRYYRHRRGRTGYMKGSIFNKLIHAETVEKAVFNAIQITLLDGANLRDRIRERVKAESKHTVTVDIEDLKRQREKLKKRTELIVATLDAETLADAQNELEKLKFERRRLDDQIAAATTATQTPLADTNAIVERIVEKTKNFFGEVNTLPNNQLREWISSVVSKVEVDMETKDIEIHISLPKDTLQTAFSGAKAMRLVSTSGSPTDYETHRGNPLAIIDCLWIKRSNHICYHCRRRAA